MCEILGVMKEMNPLWAILAVNILALFLVPYLTYRYSHENNLKVLKEKWISSLREAAASVIEVSDNLYQANDVLYQSTGSGNVLDEELRKALQKRKHEAQASFAGVEARVRLLFKNGDVDFEGLKSLMDGLAKAVDKPTKVGDILHIDTERKNEAQTEFLNGVNDILHRHWNEISK